MELKKNPKADLERIRGLFLEIGLIVSLLIIVGAFAWNQKDKVVEKLDLGTIAIEEDIIEVTRQETKPPEPVKQTITVVSDIINVVKNDAKISQSMDFTEFSEDAIVIPPKVTEKAADEEEIFFFVEENPKFMGGDPATMFRQWVGERLEYPNVARETGIQGRVVVAFVVEKDGSLTNFEVMQSPDAALSEEALRVIKLSPKWAPAKQRNRAVRLRFILPVEFRLQ